MKGHGAKFSRKKEEAISRTAVTTEHGRSRQIDRHFHLKHLFRWMKLHGVPDCISRSSPGSPMGNRLHVSSRRTTAAVSTLLKVMVNTNSPASTPACGPPTSVLNQRHESYGERGHRGARS